MGLQDHGGMTKTVAVLLGSLGYRSGDLSLWGVADDQRGLLRVGLNDILVQVVTRGAYDPDAV
jgi:hypothetical protein